MFEQFVLFDDWVEDVTRQRKSIAGLAFLWDGPCPHSKPEHMS
jgi:hypothetical protein